MRYLFLDDIYASFQFVYLSKKTTSLTVGEKPPGHFTATNSKIILDFHSYLQLHNVTLTELLNMLSQYLQKYVTKLKNKDTKKKLERSQVTLVLVSSMMTLKSITSCLVALAVIFLHIFVKRSKIYLNKS